MSRTSRFLRANRNVAQAPTLPPYLVSVDIAVGHLAVRSEHWAQAARENPDSPHAVTWCSFATLLSGEARTLARGHYDVMTALGRAGVQPFKDIVKDEDGAA